MALFSLCWSFLAHFWFEDVFRVVLTQKHYFGMKYKIFIDFAQNKDSHSLKWKLDFWLRYLFLLWCLENFILEFGYFRQINSIFGSKEVEENAKNGENSFLGLYGYFLGRVTKTTNINKVFKRPLENQHSTKLSI